MARNIIDLICNSCSCGKEEAQEYLDDEISSNLGLDQDWQIYFINRLAGL